MRVINIFWLIIFSQLSGCQIKKQSGFVIQDGKLYYDSKEIALGMSIEKFTDAMGMYDRIDIDSSDVSVVKNYFWKTKLINVNKHSDNDYFTIIKMIRDKVTGEITEDTESYKKVKTLEEIINIYGQYDSVEEEKMNLRIDKLFIWDKLGISLSAYPETNIVGNIHIQTLHVTKYWELDLGLVKNFEEQNGFPLTKEVKEKRKQDKEHFEEAPKEEYKGKFTYNGNTINLKEIGYKGWDKGVKGLGIEGPDFDPPGDSSTSSRWIKDDYDMYVTLERFSNEEEFEGLSPDKVGKFDCIKSIVIWWHKTND
ncbi:DUF7738 domain-containing protein [Flavobacterium chungangense]|uniref:DUF7738 domain-containing protein n=1 Tax=Flavobacterium chungangense TaxID=554283 RepID=A0A6V6Z9J3_9FLAO|nr:hypothetical protein [Flavobacterium chungangense]CAD0008325.1 hypothetical protein FLACHUCJ7_03736 [Flavobacterium chungangense]